MSPSRNAFLVLILVAGCTSATSISPPNGAGPAASAAGENSGGDPSGNESSGANDHDGGANDAAAEDVPPAVPTKVGRILVGETITIIQNQQYYSSFATAMFYETPPATGGGTSCTYAKLGTCQVYDCPLGGPTVDAGSLRYAGAGTVSITGGHMPYTLQTSAGGYTTISSQQLLFDSGTVLHVSATGDEVPAFSNQSLTVPSESFTLESPSSETPLSIARTQPLALSWSGAGGRDVQVSIATTEANVRSVSIACTFPGASGAGTVPAAAMGKLLSTNGATGSLSISAPTEKTFQAGDWVVTFGLNSLPWSRAFTTTN